MKVEVNSVGAPAILVLSSLIYLGISTDCAAQSLEVFAVAQQMTGDKTTGLGMPVEVDASVVGGVGAGYNIDGFNLNMDLLFGSTDITIGGVEIDSKLFCADVNLDYSIPRRSFSPVVTAGIGSVTFTDSQVSPDEFNETDFSYNVGAGLRCTVADHFVVKALFRGTWTKMKDTDDTILFSGLNVGLGYVF